MRFAMCGFFARGLPVIAPFRKLAHRLQQEAMVAGRAGRNHRRTGPFHQETSVHAMTCHCRSCRVGGNNGFEVVEFDMMPFAFEFEETGGSGARSGARPVGEAGQAFSHEHEAPARESGRWRGARPARPARTRSPADRPWPASARFNVPLFDAPRYQFETLEFESASMPTLRQGARGATVADLQRRLAAAAFSPGAADGVFGALTDAAVRAFQRARRLGIDGVVGRLTWNALLGAAPGVPGVPSVPGGAPAPLSPGDDPAIEALKLAPPARSAAYLIKSKHPWVTFTSGRRDLTRQASAMAGNVVKNRKWIEQTYADNPVSRAAQGWVDAHPQARTSQAIAAGLLGVFRGFSSADLGRLSYHLSGLAFDIHPVPSQLAAISATIHAVPRLKEFFTREGGLDIWHVGLA